MNNRNVRKENMYGLEFRMKLPIDVTNLRYFEVKTWIFNKIMISYIHQNYLENCLLAMQILLWPLALAIIDLCRFFLESIIYSPSPIFRTGDSEVNKRKYMGKLYNMYNSAQKGGATDVISSLLLKMMKFKCRHQENYESF